MDKEIKYFTLGYFSGIAAVFIEVVIWLIVSR